MKKNLLYFLAFVCLVLSLPAYSISYTWTGLVSSDYLNAGNWSPAGIPSTGDDVFIGPAPHAPVFEEWTGVRHFTINGSSLNLSGFTYSISGNAQFINASVINGNIEFLGAAAHAVLFQTSVFQVGLSGSAGGFRFNHSTFYQPVSLNKISNHSLLSEGGNIFHSDFSFSTDNGSFHTMAANFPDIFNANVYLRTIANGKIAIASSSVGNQFNGHLFISMAGSNNVISIGAGGGSSTMAAGRGIFNGPDGFNNGSFSIYNLVKLGTAPIQLLTTGNTTIHFGAGNDLRGTVNVQCSNILFDGTRFRDSVLVHKTGNQPNVSAGGNSFRGFTRLSTQSHSLVLGESAPDSILGTMHLISSSNNGINIARASAGNYCNANIFYQGNNSTVFTIGQLGGTLTFAPGRGLQFINPNANTGTLTLNGIQVLGSDTFRLVSNRMVNIGSQSVFHAPVSIQAAGVSLNNARFNAFARIVRNGNLTSNSGGNRFQQEVHIVNAHNSGNFSFGVAQPDSFYNTLRLRNESSGMIMMASSSTGNVFQEHIYVANTHTSGNSGIQFSNESTGSAVLAANKNILVWSGQFNQGRLRIFNLQRSGTATFTLSGFGSNASVQVLNGCQFNSRVGVVAPNILLAGTTFQRSARFTKTVSSLDNFSAGGNVFQDSALFINQSDKVFALGNAMPDVFQSLAIFTNETGNGTIHPARTAPNNLFQGDIVLNSATAGGIRFCSNGGSILHAAGTLRVGTLGLSAGLIEIGNYHKTSSNPIHISATGTALIRFTGNSTVDGAVTIAAPQLQFAGTRFLGHCVFTKTGTGDNNSAGGNAFFGTCHFINTGSGHLLMGHAQPDTFHSALNLRSSGSSRILMAHNAAGHVFNGNITLESTGSATGIFFGNGNGSATHASGTLQIGASGFGSGTLFFQRFHKSSATAVSMVGTANTSLQLRNGCLWNGTFAATFPNVSVELNRFQQAVTLTQTGANQVSSGGGNFFESHLTLSTTSAGRIFFGDHATRVDTVMGNLSLSSSSSGSVHYARNAVGHYVHGNIVVSSTSTSTGIHFGMNGGRLHLGNNGLIQIGSSGFSSGTLRLANVFKTNTMAMALAGSGNAIFMAENSDLAGNITLSFPGLELRSNVFRNQVTYTKVGNTSTTSAGGNEFMGPVVLNNNTSATLTFANTAGMPDIFRSTLTLNNTGSGLMQMAQNAMDNEFHGDVILTSTGSSQGIRFGNGTGSWQLMPGASLQTGASGFTVGVLTLRRLTQLGNGSQILSQIAGSATLNLSLNNVFNGPVEFVFPQMLLSGNTFHNTALLRKSGAIANSMIGGNTFNSAATLINSSSANWVWGTTDPDVFNGPLTLQSSGSAGLFLAHGGTGHTFNHNLHFISQGTSTGIYIGQNNGLSTQLGNGQITMGTFSSGGLVIRGLKSFTEQDISLTGFTGAASLRLETNNEFHAKFIATGADIRLNGTYFRNSVHFTKTGSITSSSDGGNRFGGSAIFANTGTGQWLLSNASTGEGDLFEQQATFTQTTNNTLYPAARNTSTFLSNISIEGSAHNIRFGFNGGTVLLAGNRSQRLEGNVTRNQLFTRLQINKTDSMVVAELPVQIFTDLHFIRGIYHSTHAALLIFNHGSTASNVSNLSFVSGPVRKVGNTAFVFPVGKGNAYRPIAISAPANNTHHFTAEYFHANPGTLYPLHLKPASVDRVLNCEYWMLDRTGGTSNVSVTLSWAGSTSCSFVDANGLRVMRWNGSAWADHGLGSVSSNGSTGSITSAGAISSFSPFTFGDANPESPLPVEFIEFNADVLQSQVHLQWSTASETNNQMFEIERSKDLQTFERVGKVLGAGNSNQILHYAFIDQKPLPGISYYRIKQIDFNGDFSYSNIEMVFMAQLPDASVVVQLFPNPATDYVSVSAQGLAAGLYSCAILNLQGQTMVRETLDINPSGYGQPLLISHLGPGIYLLQIETPGGRLSARWIKK